MDGLHFRDEYPVVQTLKQLPGPGGTSAFSCSPGPPAGGREEQVRLWGAGRPGSRWMALQLGVRLVRQDSSSSLLHAPDLFVPAGLLLRAQHLEGHLLLPSWPFIGGSQVPEFFAGDCSSPVLSCGITFSHFVLKFIFPYSLILSQANKSEFTKDSNTTLGTGYHQISPKLRTPLCNQMSLVGFFSESLPLISRLQLR